MPTMRVKIRKTEAEVVKTYFGGSLSQASKSPRPWTEIEPSWCDLSEFRLFTKVVEYKPLGPNKNFNLLVIADYMNHVYEDEPNHILEEFLTTKDIIVVQKRFETKNRDDILRFEPRYRIRPTIEQIEEKLKGMFDMKNLDKQESEPEGFTMSSDFFLPEGEYSELMQKLESERPTPLRPPPPKKRRRRGGSTDSDSRAATPASS